MSLYGGLGEQNMNEWEDDTLVAIEIKDNGTCKVLELPARQTNVITSRRTFASWDAAEGYIDDQYPGALAVQAEDVRAEARNRKASYARR